MKPGNRGIADLGRVWRAAGYSIKGFRAAWREAAFRQEVVLFVVLAPVGAWFGRSGIERALLIGSLLLVLIVEILNSAIEAVVDRTGSERHKLSAAAKDMGSLAVLVSIVFAVLTWGLVLLGR